MLSVWTIHTLSFYCNCNCVLMNLKGDFYYELCRN
uniref:Uncharacterized protein n=1 Tax=Myoviridae sp. ctaOv25 TaxID=2827290 RepID=A0A8S5R6D6_9CAUD|nr:MAG TPA: hypothetical protein [Myoviridae sp. ctaOv25]